MCMKHALYVLHMCMGVALITRESHEVLPKQARVVRIDVLRLIYQQQQGGALQLIKMTGCTCNVGFKRKLGSGFTT